MSEISKTPEPPYYAVIFISHRTKGNNNYQKTANRMFELAALQPGFLGAESASLTFSIRHKIVVIFWHICTFSILHQYNSIRTDKL